MSVVVFGGLVFFAIYAMVHFIHEWREAKQRREADDRGDGRTN
jgi:uncharacterized membrane protein